MTSPQPTKALYPREAATLIILRGSGNTTQVLMGKRHAGHKFMPGKFVFPGGRVDYADCRYQPVVDLHPKVAGKLMAKMRGRSSAGRARGLAMAAVRETFEETGLVIGQPMPRPSTSRSRAWRDFADTGYGPDLSGLRLFARAITPPGRPRRFDTRFFVVAENHVCNPNEPIATDSQELLGLYWFSIDEAMNLDIPWITSQILQRLTKALSKQDGLDPGARLTYQRMIGKNWHYETI